MSKQAVLDAALQLSEADRREIAECLFDSLSQERESTQLEYEAEWTEEIDRRLNEIREGRAKLVPWKDTQARMHAIVEEARRRRA